MSDKLRFALLVLVVWGCALAAVAAAAMLVVADADPAQRSMLASALADRAASVVVAALLLFVALAFVVGALRRRYVTAAKQLAEDARIMFLANPEHRAPARGSAEMRSLAAAFNGFAEAHASLRRDVELRIRDANERIAQERNRLAALMSELAQSVIMCNVEGRILLYNARAMQLLRKPLEGAAATGKAHSLVGLGRSIFAIFDRNLIIHALDGIHDRRRQGVRSPVVTFITTAPAGRFR
jgi:DNA polymerase III subunit epsilon